jgi:hypothetical protein
MAFHKRDHRLAGVPLSVTVRVLGESCRRRRDRSCLRQSGLDHNITGMEPGERQLRLCHRLATAKGTVAADQRSWKARRLRIRRQREDCPEGRRGPLHRA